MTLNPERGWSVAQCKYLYKVDEFHPNGKLTALLVAKILVPGRVTEPVSGHCLTKPIEDFIHYKTSN